MEGHAPSWPLAGQVTDARDRVPPNAIVPEYLGPRRPWNGRRTSDTMNMGQLAARQEKEDGAVCGKEDTVVSSKEDAVVLTRAQIMDPERLGPYRVLRPLGRGGMGVVYEAEEGPTGQRVAVKLVAAAAAPEHGLRTRFEAEIQTLRQLNHPNIVRLLGFGEEGGQLYYAMELVEGDSLETELARGRRFDWREVVQIAVQVCQALRHAHDRGIIHRDIKPSNLLLAPAGQVKLSDFGIARIFGQTRLTVPGNVVGTAEFMAPEQAEGQTAGPASDLYSLGALMYVLLSGKPLFRARSLPEMLHKQRFEHPEPLASLVRDLPEELDRLIAELLDKDPRQRPAAAGVVHRRLAAIEQAYSVEAASAPADEPGQDGADLFETRATAAFGRGHSRPASELTQPAAGGTSTGTAKDRFVPVHEEELDRAESPRTAQPLRSAQTWLLILSLAVLGLVGWYFLKPPSADELYRRIDARLDGSTGELLAAEGDIQTFLERFPGDPRAEGLRERAREIRLIQVDRSFERQAREPDPEQETREMLPVERAYLGALRTAQVDPARGAEELRAIVALYGELLPGPQGPEGASERTAVCVELARGRLATLEERLAEQHQQDLQAVLARLDQADRLRAALAERTEQPEQPDEAQQMERFRAVYRAVVELYGDEPWAAGAVERARRALGASDSTAESDSASPRGSDSGDPSGETNR